MPFLASPRQLFFSAFFCPFNIQPPLQLFFTFFLPSFLRGFGFVTYAEQAGVEKVLAQNRHELDSKTVSPACLRHWVDFTDSFERACHPPPRPPLTLPLSWACKIEEFGLASLPPPPPASPPLSAHFPLQIPVQGANMKAFFLGLHCHGYLGDLNGVGAPAKPSKGFMQRAPKFFFSFFFFNRNKVCTSLVAEVGRGK